MTEEAREAQRIYEREKRARRTPEQKARDAAKHKKYQKTHAKELKVYRVRYRERKKQLLYAEWLPEYSEQLLNREYDGELIKFIKAHHGTITADELADFLREHPGQPVTDRRRTRTTEGDKEP